MKDWKIGMMEDWKNVRLEECIIGRVYNWKSVRLEECKIRGVSDRKSIRLKHCERERSCECVILNLGGFSTLLSIISVNYPSILKILLPILLHIFLNFPKNTEGRVRTVQYSTVQYSTVQYS